MIKQQQPLAHLYRLLAHPARLAILETLRDGEQCVCHIEATLELRQAYISQQLRGLKDAGIVAARREGWNQYYRVVKRDIFTVIDAMYRITGISRPMPATDVCECPKCSQETPTQFTLP